MLSVRIFLFRSLRVVADKGQLLDLGSPTTRSLFAYLVLHRDQPIDRRWLAFTYWPRGTESAARRNLRQYLHRIRRALEPVDPQGVWLATDGTTVQFASQMLLWLDVEAFRHFARPNAGVDELAQAINLYAGDLLEDVYDDWCENERRALRQTYLNSLDRISRAYLDLGKSSEAQQYLYQWVQVEPFNESAHRRIIRLYALNGERYRAMQHYLAFKESLFEEFAAEPMPETQALYKAVQTDDLRTRENHLPALEKSFIQVAKAPQEKAAPFIGRQSEFQTLSEILEQSRNGQGRFVIITGESGVGKTRLVHEFLLQHQRLPKIQGNCHELGLTLPYSPLRQMLPQVIDLFPERAFSPAPFWLQTAVQLAPVLVERFPYLSGQNTVSEESPYIIEMLLNMLISLLAQIGGQPNSFPLLFVLDDLHWGDKPTWNFLTHLAHYVQKHCLLVIGLCRLEDLPVEQMQVLRSLDRRGLIQQISLTRLSSMETATLAANLLPNWKDNDIFLKRLYQETEGNPFFIIEIIRSMKEIGRPIDLLWDGKASNLMSGLPRSIQLVIEARLDRLSAQSQELLAIAAVIGRAFDFSLLQAISQVPAEENVGYIEEWLQRDLIREYDSRYDFSHEKIRQVAYARLTHARRQYIHGRVADVLERAITPVEPTILAYHFTRSDQPLKALPYLTQAGEQALRVRSYQEARQFGQQAIGLLGRLPGPRQREERIDLSLQLAQAYAFAGELEHAQEMIGEVEHLAINLGDNLRLVNLFRCTAQIFWLRGQPELAGDYARRTLRLAEELEDTRLVLAALRMLGRVSIALAAFDDAIAYLLRYSQMANGAPKIADQPIVLGYLGVAYMRVGSWQHALDTARRGLELAEKFVQEHNIQLFSTGYQAVAFARMQLAFIYADYQDWKTCMEILRPIPDSIMISADLSGDEIQSVKLSQTAKGFSLTPLGFMLFGLRGLAAVHLGDTDNGIKMIRNALDWADRADYRVFNYLPRKFLAEALLLAGKYDKAIEESERCLALARAANNRWAVGTSLRLVAEAMSRKQAPNWIQIEAILLESIQLLRQVRARPDLARTYLALRKLYDRAGQIAWAVDCHFRATMIFEELGMVEELRQAQGRSAAERQGATVITGIPLLGPHFLGEST